MSFDKYTQTGGRSLLHDLVLREVEPVEGVAVSPCPALARVVEALVELGADVNALDNGGYTPLHLASARGDVPTIEALVRAGAGLEVQTEQGDTPLYVAVYWNQLEAVRALVAAGAAVDTVLNDTRLPLFPGDRGAALLCLRTPYVRPVYTIPTSLRLSRFPLPAGVRFPS